MLVNDSVASDQTSEAAEKKYESRRSEFSVCIPAYNRARYLPRLLESILSQDYQDFEVLICEDNSTERPAIRAIAERFAQVHQVSIRYYENEKNLGFDGNTRKLVELARGKFCFFMGNDDVMCPGALRSVADVIARNPDIGVVLKSYSFSDSSAGHVCQEVRYFAEERRFEKGREAITLCFRRSGVLAGYIVRRDPAQKAATDRYDGTLFYQMHLTAQVLSEWPAVFTPKVLVHCGGDETPDFGHSSIEKGKYVPGSYTPEARLNMVNGALRIIRDLDPAIAEDVQHDYANYFYPYIKDQLKIPVVKFIKLYRAYGKMGFNKYPMFHFYCVVAYALGERKFDVLTKTIRKMLGSSPRIGNVRQGRLTDESG